ncbi:MAG: RNA polymerase sigma factor [Myxococcota bacterium]
MPSVTDCEKSPPCVPLDEELIQGVRDGDEGAFSRLYDCYFQRVYSFAYARLRDRADSEDAVQETFTAVFESLGGFEGKASLLSWIYGIARNVVNTHIRRAQAEARRVDKTEMGLARSVASLDMCTPEQTLGLRRCAAAVETQLREVSGWQAEAFEMRHFNDLPIQEIADRVERSNDAVRSGLYRVKRLVFEAVDPGALRLR